MDNFPLVEIAISLILIYFLLSIVISGIQEILSGIIIKSRSSFLREAIDKAFNDPQNKNWAEFIYGHPLVSKLKRKANKNPSYISSKIFSTCLVDIITNEGKLLEFKSDEPGEIEYKEELLYKNPLDNYVYGLKTLATGDVKTLLESLSTECDNIKQVKQNISDWFENYMDRVSGWYKRKVRWVTLILAVFITLLLNIDSIQITRDIWSNKELRRSLISYAENVVEQNQSKFAQYNIAVQPDTINLGKVRMEIQEVDSVINEIQALNIPIGWVLEESLRKTIYNNIENVPLKISGWIITILALSLGAPFWFRLLTKLVNIRNTGELPKKEK